MKSKRNVLSIIILSALLLSLLLAVALLTSTGDVSHSPTRKLLATPIQPEKQQPVGTRIKIFSSYSDQSTALKQRQDLAASNGVEHLVLSVKEQAEFLESHVACGSGAKERFQQLPNHLGQELFKYCALFEYGGMYLDAESPLLDTVEHLLSKQFNMAVLNDPAFPKTMHGSMLLLRKPRSNIAKGMIQVIMTTAVDVLNSSPLLLPRTLHDLIAMENSVSSLFAGPVGDWFFLQHKCNVDPLRREVSLGVSSLSLNSYRYVCNRRCFVICE